MGEGMDFVAIAHLGHSALLGEGLLAESVLGDGGSCLKNFLGPFRRLPIQFKSGAQGLGQSLKVGLGVECTYFRRFPGWLDHEGAME